MIKIVIKESDDIDNIEIKGHANYAEYGNDIICASVSSIAITTINSILRIDDKAILYEEENGYLKISIVNHSDTINKLIINMIDLFEELEKQYKKHIEIRRCHL